MNVMLSIIVPVYNKEKYLIRSLTSLKNQTFKNFEVIIVDDGSIDNSKDICMDFCFKDSRFKYFYKKNNGVASARNCGLDKAKGKFIGFVDPDDYIDREMYEKLIEKAIKGNFDIVECGVMKLANGKLEKETFFNKAQMSQKEAIVHLLKWDKEVTPYLWNKIFRKSILENTYFNDTLKVGEDIAFIFECLMKIKKYKHINDYLYTYVKNGDSLVGIGYKSSSAKNSIKSSEYICRLCKCKYTEYSKLSEYSLLFNCYIQMCMILHENNYEKYKEDLKYYRKVCLEIDNEIIKYYGNTLEQMKISCCIYAPQIYKKILKLKNIFIKTKN